jgi:hypothetical protein
MGNKQKKFEPPRRQGRQEKKSYTEETEKTQRDTEKRKIERERKTA